MAQAPPCPNCGGTSYQLEDRRWLTCSGCGKQYDVQTDVCRACGRLNEVDAKHCAYCQAELPRDPVSRLIETRTMDRLDWRQQQTETGVRQKDDEERASRARMEAYWAQEQARREAASRATLRRKEREKKVLIVVGVIAVLLILCMVAAGIVLSQLSKGLLVQAPESVLCATAVARHGVLL